MTATSIATMVRNAHGKWETIETESATAPVDLSSVTVSAADIGGQPGQPVRVEIRQEDGDVLDSVEIQSS